MNHSTMFSLSGYQSANKKQLKDSTPWHQQPQPHQPAHVQSPWSDDDGGWSKGTPGGGSGWGNSRAPQTSSEQNPTRGGTNREWGVQNNGGAGAGGDGATSGGWGSKWSPDTGGWSSTALEQSSAHDTADTWNSDNDTSQSNGKGEAGCNGWQAGTKWSASDNEAFDKEGLAADSCSQDCVLREERVSHDHSTGSDVEDADNFSLSSSDKDTQVFSNTGDSSGSAGGGVATADGSEGGRGNQQGGVVASGLHTTTEPIAQGHASNGPSPPSMLLQPPTPVGKQQKMDAQETGRPGRPDLGNGQSEIGRSEVSNGTYNSSGGSGVGVPGGWKGDGRGKGAKNGGGARGRLDSNHGSQVNSGGCGKSRKKQKPAVDLGDALGALQSEPSGWGELPSPKPNENDTGTECWGVPPDMKERLERGGGQKAASEGSPGCWGDQSAAKDWSEKDVGTNWNSKDGTQWGNGWVNRSKQDRADTFNFNDAVRSLVDMGFPHQASEKALKLNNNNLDATIGDLLALQALQEDESMGGLQQSQQPYIIPSALSAKNKRPPIIASRPPQTTPTPTMHSTTANPTVTMATAPVPPPPVSSAPSATPTYQQQQQQLHTLQTLLALQNPILPQQTLLQAPVTPQQQAMHSQVLQTLLQQQRVFGISSLLPLPNIQQVLTQQLGQAQLTRQQIMAQLKAPGQQGAGAQQQLQVHLARCNQYISLINQQLVVLSVQQKEKAQQEAKVGGSSPQIGRSNSLPAKSKAEQKVVMSNGTVPRLPFNGAIATNSDMKTLPYAMQGLALGPTVTTSAPTGNLRSTSRLQQLIPGGEGLSAATKEDFEGSGVVAGVPPPQTTAPSQSISSPLTAQGQTSLSLSLQSQSLSSSYTVSVGNTPTSIPATGDSPAAGSTAPPTSAGGQAPPTSTLADIPEFRPGVLWQPRTQPTEPAQLYAVKSSHSLPSTPLSLPESIDLKASGLADAVQNSILGSSGGSTGGSRMDKFGVGGALSMTLPSQPYHQPHPIGTQPIGSQVGMAKSAKARVYPTGTGQQHVGRAGVGLGTSNGAVLGGGAMGVGSVGMVNRPNIRRSLSTSGVTSPGQVQASFNSSFSGIGSPHAQAYATIKKRGSLPQAMPSGLDASVSQSQFAMVQQRQQQNSNLGHSDGRRWGSGPDVPAAAKGWGPESHGKSKWNQETGWKNAFGTALSFDDSLQQPVASLDQYPTSNTALGSLAVGGRTWAQDGMGAPFNGPLSPEPTYVEWQAGKKARFPHAKSGSNPPSLWLIVKNITPQVDEMTLREVCSEYGFVQSCILSPNMDLAFVKYASQNDVKKAKLGLDSNPNICGIVVSVDFISEAEVAELHEQSTQLHQDSDHDFNNLDGGSLPAWMNDGFDDEAQIIGEQFVNGPDQSKWNNTVTSGYSKYGPRSSMWNDGNFLSGLSTPWQNTHLSRQDHEDANTLLGGSPSNYLPNGLV